MNFRRIAGAALLLGVGACGESTLHSELPATLETINDVIGDTRLSSEQKREELEAMGLDPLTINALLRDEVTANQFGGDLTSAFEKVTGGRMTELTPDEVQIYANGVGEADPASSVNIGDDAAQDIVDLFRANGIDTRAELGALLETPGVALPSSIPDGALTTIFVDFDPQGLSEVLP